MTPHEQFTDVAKVAPSLTVTGMTIMGFPMSDWVLLLTALYTVMQMALLVQRSLRKSQSGATTCIKDCNRRVRHDDER